MKNLFKAIIFKILEIEARLVLLRYRPKIIAVSGTVGKTTTKDAIYHALSGSLHVRKNNKSMNSEIGVPLTILGLPTGWDSSWQWFSNIVIGALEIIYYPKYPKWLVIEIGIDHPGDMKKTASWLKPDIAVLTAFGDVPVHVEFFESPDAVSAEEADVINYLKKDGVIILNADDEKAIRIKSRAKNKVFTFGYSEEADFKASNYSLMYKEERPKGVSFKVNYNGSVIPIVLSGVIGDQLVYPVLASLAVGVALDLSLVNVAERFFSFKAPKGRMNVLEGKNGAVIIDDSYNASPIAVSSAVRNLAEIDNVGTKIAVLGDMAEIGRFSASEHRKIGELIKKHKIDYLVTVGLASELINQEAIENGMAKSRNFHFRKSEEAISTVQNLIEKSKGKSAILVKGSQSIRTEKIVKAILADENEAEDLLVRQEKEWLER